MEQLVRNNELIEWLIDLENNEILDKIDELKKNTPYDSENNFQTGHKLEAFRTEIKKRIKNYSSDK